MSTDLKRIPDYDLMRALATLSVVGIHVIAAAVRAPHGMRGVDAAVLVKNLLWYATPAFAALTGALVWTGVPPRTWEQLGRFFRRRASVVLIPYLFWSAIYILFVRTPLPMASAGQAAAAASTHAGLLLFGSAWYHLYFIPVVLVLYLLAPLVTRIEHERSWLVLGIALVVGVFYQLLPPAPLHFTRVFVVISAVLWFAPFAAVGAWYAMHRDRIDPIVERVWPLLVAASMAGRLLMLRPAWIGRPVLMPFGWMQRGMEYVIALTALAGLLGLVRWLAERIPGLVSHARRLSDTSYGVYLVHPIVILYTYNYLLWSKNDALWRSPLFVLGAYLFVFGLTHGVVSLLASVRLLAWTVTAPPRRPVPEAPPVTLPEETVPPAA